MQLITRSGDQSPHGSPPPHHPWLDNGTSLASLRPAWVYDSGEDVATPIGQAADGPVLLACGDSFAPSTLRALDPRDGTVRWSVDHAFYPGLTPTLTPDGHLYDRAFDSRDLELRDVQTGDVKSVVTPDFDANTAIAVEGDGTLVVGGTCPCGDQGLFAVDPATGQDKWRFDPHGPLLPTAPTVGPDGRVYCTTQDGQIYALDGASGKTLWSFEPDTPIGQSVTVGPNGTVYAVDDNDTVYAIDPHQAESDGHAVPVWQAALDKPVANPYGVAPLNASQPLFFAGDDLVAVTTGQNVRGLDPVTGATRWEEDVPIFNPPAQPQPGALLVHPDGDGVVELNGSSGRPMAEWRQAPLSGAPGSAPTAVVLENVASGRVAAFPR